MIEKPSKDAFIDRSPIEIIASGNFNKAPWITGVVSEDGLYPVAGINFVKRSLIILVNINSFTLIK